MTPATPAFQGVPEYLPDEKQHRKRLAKAVNQLTQGKMNVRLAVTLRASQTTTVINDARIGFYSWLGFMATTASATAAIAAGIYVASQQTGQATLTHASNAATDQTLLIAIIG